METGLALSSSRVTNEKIALCILAFWPGQCRPAEHRYKPVIACGDYAALHRYDLARAVLQLGSDIRFKHVVTLAGARVLEMRRHHIGQWNLPPRTNTVHFSSMTAVAKSIRTIGCDARGRSG